MSESRPWGCFRTVEKRENYHIKHITVFPGHQFSLQLHLHREEHWTIIKGQGVAQVDETWTDVCVGDTVHIPVQVKHRLRNPFSEPLEFLEIQIGEGANLTEEDIVRLQDDYGR